MISYAGTGPRSSVWSGVRGRASSGQMVSRRRRSDSRLPSPVTSKTGHRLRRFSSQRWTSRPQARSTSRRTSPRSLRPSARKGEDRLPGSCCAARGSSQRTSSRRPPTLRPRPMRRAPPRSVRRRTSPRWSLQRRSRRAVSGSTRTHGRCSAATRAGVGCRSSATARTFRRAGIPSQPG